MKSIAGIFTIKGEDEEGRYRSQKYSMIIQLPIDIEPEFIDFDWDDPESLLEEG